MINYTLKDVAREAGVSKTLISMHLNGNPNARMKSETRKKIEDTISRLHYSPSSQARSLRCGRTQIIGLVVGNLRNPTFSLFADYVMQLLNQKGYQLLVSPSGFGEKVELDTLRSLLTHRPDGIIYYHTHLFKSEFIDKLAKEKYPLLLLDQESKKFPTYSMEQCGALKQAVAFFKEHGHKEIHLLNSAYSSWPAIVEEECRNHKLKLKLATLPVDWQSRILLLREICNGKSPAILIDACQTTVLLLRLIDTEFPDYKPEITCAQYFPHPVFCDPRIVGIIRKDIASKAREALAKLLSIIESKPCSQDAAQVEFIVPERNSDDYINLIFSNENSVLY